MAGLAFEERMSTVRSMPTRWGTLHESRTLVYRLISAFRPTGAGVPTELDVHEGITNEALQESAVLRYRGDPTYRPGKHPYALEAASNGSGDTAAINLGGQPLERIRQFAVSLNLSKYVV
jgi:hypothetical protein